MVVRSFILALSGHNIVLTVLYILEKASHIRKTFLCKVECLSFWLAHPLRDKIFNSNRWLILFFLQTIVYIDELIDNVDTFFEKILLFRLHGA